MSLLAPHFRKTALVVLASLGALTSINSQAEGGFVSLQGGITDSQDMDKFNNAFKVQFGGNILDNFALEFGLLDMGEASFDDPTPTYDGVSDTVPPRFSDAAHGSVSRSPKSTSAPSRATFTGLSKAHPQGFLFTFRVKLPITDSVDFFFKTGANAWWADYERIELTADQNKVVTRRVVKKGNTSAVDQITGGGFLWEPLPNIAVRAELETTALDSLEFKRARFQLLTLGAQYEF